MHLKTDVVLTNMKIQWNELRNHTTILEHASRPRTRREALKIKTRKLRWRILIKEIVEYTEFQAGVLIECNTEINQPDAS